MKEYEFDIAISYASEQINVVKRTVEFLKKYGINVYFAPENQNCLVAKNILTELTDIYLNKCRYILAFISKEYLEKDITKNELSIALSRISKGENCLLPVSVNQTRYFEIDNDLYYFDLSKESEYSLAEKIANFIINEKRILIKEKNLIIPDNAIIFLAGATGVGKTTIARKLLELYPEIIVMGEVDLIREALRCYVENTTFKTNVKKIGNKTQSHTLNYDLILKSTSDLSYDEMIMQAECMYEPIKRMCWRLRDKKLPAILEGVNLPFEALFKPFDNENYFIYSSNMVFINLYLQNKEEHKNRIISRAMSRGLSESELDEIMKKFQNIRIQNQKLHEKALYYSQKLTENSNDKKSNIFSIDISGNQNFTISKNVDLSVQEIVKIIQDVFN